MVINASNSAVLDLMTKVTLYPSPKVNVYGIDTLIKPTVTKLETLWTYKTRGMVVSKEKVPLREVLNT